MAHKIFKDCMNGHESKVKSALTSSDPPVTANLEDSTNDRRLIHCAASHGHLGVVKMLVKYGANINATDHAGKHPVHLAAENGHLKVLKYLLSKNGSISSREKIGEQPIHSAIRGEHENVVRYLLKKKHGAKIDDTRYDKSQPIHIASETGSLAMMRLCVEMGADVNAATAAGKTPFDIARTDDVIKVLKDCGGQEGTHPRHDQADRPAKGDDIPSNTDRHDGLIGNNSTGKKANGNFCTASEPKSQKNYEIVQQRPKFERYPSIQHNREISIDGLAWQYFQNWLNKVLPDMEERFNATCRFTQHEWNIDNLAQYQNIPCLIVIIPKHGYSKHSLSEYDPNVQLIDSTTFKLGKAAHIRAQKYEDVAGYKSKSMCNSFFHSTVDGQEYIYICEIPSCLATWNEIMKTSSSDVPQQNHIKVFIRQLSKIIGKFGKAHQRAIKLLYFDDKDKDRPLSGLIADTIKETTSDCLWIPSCTRQILQLDKGDLGEGDDKLDRPDFIGMAWSHYYGFYYLVLKGLESRIEQTEMYTAKTWNISDKEYMLFSKMIAIIPGQGYKNVTSLSEYDSRIKILTSKTEREKGKPKGIKAEYHENRAGFPDKDYSNFLFYIETDEKIYIFVAEVPSCIRSLKIMTQTDFVRFTEEDHMMELEKFRDELKHITSIQTDMPPVFFIDYDEKGDKPLADKILDIIENN